MRIIRKVIEQIQKDHPSSPENTPLLTDFEKSPLRFQFEALLEEYRAVRAEIIMRLENQQYTNSFAIAFIAVVVTLIQATPHLVTADRVPDILKGIYLVGSYVFNTLAIVNLLHEVMIYHLGYYIRKVLRPQLNEILATTLEHKPTVMEWDQFYLKEIVLNPKVAIFEFILGSSRFAITVGPGVALLIIYSLIRNFDEPVPTWEQVFYVIAVIVTVMLLFVLLYALLQNLLHPSIPNR
jgi:hypothetical protein